MAVTCNVDEVVACQHEACIGIERRTFHESVIPVGLVEIKVLTVCSVMKKAFRRKSRYTKVVDDKTVLALAEIPSKEVLIAKFLGSIRSPLYGLAYALQAIVDKGGEAAPAAEEAPAEAAPAEA